MNYDNAVEVLYLIVLLLVRVRVVQRGINTEETNAEDVEPPTGLIVEPNQAYEVLVKSCDSKLRMSRSFGDFLFKMNEDVQPHLQAVIAVPEIIICERTRRFATFNNIFIDYIALSCIVTRSLLLLVMVYGMSCQIRMFATYSGINFHSIQVC